MTECLAKLYYLKHEKRISLLSKDEVIDSELHRSNYYNLMVEE